MFSSRFGLINLVFELFHLFINHLQSLGKLFVQSQVSFRLISFILEARVKVFDLLRLQLDFVFQGLDFVLLFKSPLFLV